MRVSEELKISAILGIIGGVAATVTGPIHPLGSVSGGHETNTALHMKEIAEASAWTGVHLSFIISSAFILCGLLALIHFHRLAKNQDWVLPAKAFAIITAALSFVTLTIDGFIMKNIAVRFNEMNPEVGSGAYFATQGFENLELGLFSTVIFVNFGLAYIVYGLMVLHGKLLPGWLGVVAILSGVLGTFAGLYQLVDGTSIITIVPFVICSTVSTLWVAILSLLVLRRSKQLAESSS
jgi:hypothetical protein